MKTIYLHLGVPKTATTFLQKALFPALEDVEYTPKEKLKELSGGQGIDTLFRYSPLIWREEESARRILDHITQIRRRTILISEECIHGGQFPPVSLRPYNDHKPDWARRDGYDLCTLARHVAEISAQINKQGAYNVRAIVTIRRQDTKLASSYAEISSNLEGASQRDFEQWIERLLAPDHFYRRSGAAKLDYHWFYECLAHEIGGENVFFLPYEELKIDPRGYINTWCRMLGGIAPREGFDYPEERVNKKSEGGGTWTVSPPAYMGPRIRPKSALMDKFGVPNRIPARFVDRGRDTTIHLTEALSDFIMGKYRSSNAALNSQLESFDLEGYGYC